MLLGHLFVQALKAVAPILVLVLVASAHGQQEIGNGPACDPFVGLSMAATSSAALLAVVVSSLFPTDLVLLTVGRDEECRRQGVIRAREPAVRGRNPVSAIASSSFISVRLRVWRVRSSGMRHASAAMQSC